MPERVQTYEDFHFQRKKEALLTTLENIRLHKKVNEFLKKYNWLFISPLFFQGFEINYILKLSETSGDQSNNIKDFFYKKFYRLDWTSSFVEGYCNRSPYIIPFLDSIEHSIVLAYQKDYEGAIKTAIPIVEGIMRKYLFVEKGKEMEDISFKNLKNCFNLIYQDIITEYENYLTNYQTENKIRVSFTKPQIKELINLQKKYFASWLLSVTDFINNSLYLNTKNNIITTELNRHAILHEYGIGTSYNLENYIKIYLVLNYLTWALLIKDNKNVLNNIDEARMQEKIMAYRRIIQYAEKIALTKDILYKK